MADNASTKVMTGKVRLSYAHLITPYTSDPVKNDAKYSVTLIIPKEDTATMRKLRAAEKAAAEAGAAKFGGRVPKNLKSVIHDGDEEADLEKNPEYEGCYYMAVSSKTKPALADKYATPILDTEEVYSGMYARAKLGAFAYNTQGNKGVSFGLDGIQKLADGERLGGGAAMKAEDFEVYEDDEDGLI